MSNAIFSKRQESEYCERQLAAFRRQVAGNEGNNINNNNDGGGDYHDDNHQKCRDRVQCLRRELSDWTWPTRLCLVNCQDLAGVNGGTARVKRSGCCTARSAAVRRGGSSFAGHQMVLSSGNSSRRPPTVATCFGTRPSCARAWGKNCTLARPSLARCPRRPFWRIGASWYRF